MIIIRAKKNTLPCFDWYPVKKEHFVLQPFQNLHN